jgi:hypothetical protein
MNCPYCGGEMREGSVLCTQCGRLTPEFERTYRRPDPTVGGAKQRDRRSYDPDVTAEGRTPRATNPRLLLVLVIGAIALLLALSLVIGAFLPRETTEAYREAVQEGAPLPEGYEDVIDTYLSACSDGERDAIPGLYPPSLRDENMDMPEYFGKHVERYSITGAYPHSASDAAGVGVLLGETVTHYVDVEVSVRFSGAQEDEVWDFDLVRIDGTWYLSEIW